MSRLEELIEKLCPDGVEYKKIIDVADVSIGEFVHKSKQNPNSQYPVFNGGTSNTGFYDEYNRTANKIIISARGANAGFVNRVFTNFWSGNSCYTVDFSNDAVNWNFAFYWLKSKEKKLLGEQQKGGIPAVSKKQVESFPIPVPPLEVQDEIVKILDNFTELTAELTARKKQYEHYLENLLFSAKDVKMVTLGEITSFYNGDRGKNYPKVSEMVEEGIPFVNAGDIDGTVDYANCNKITREKYCSMSGAKLKKGDILYCLRGSTGKNGIYELNEGTVASSLVAIRASESINYKFLYYLLNSSIEKAQRLKYDTGAAQPNLSAKNVREYIFPVPPLEEQQRIVDILDRFDKLCNDISEGLPAEIEARQKQYEYYRDKLLSFKSLSLNS